jgi:hypothetical protein
VSEQVRHEGNGYPRTLVVSSIDQAHVIWFTKSVTYCAHNAAFTETCPCVPSLPISAGNEGLESDIATAIVLIDAFNIGFASTLSFAFASHDMGKVPYSFIYNASSFRGSPVHLCYYSWPALSLNSVLPSKAACFLRMKLKFPG